ncbi:MAG: Gingipain R1 precursor [Bacteroidetes bacterium ADurb.Bin234]|nr:MAG: Gingipain R1 precursor [Bacteroidetes bacterium ADurb.Bin234]
MSFLIPIDKKVESITIDSVSIQQLAGTYAIYPVQTPVPTSISLSSVSFDDPDTAIYNHSTPYPAIRYEIINDGYPMGYHVITLTFYPLEYIPSDSILNLYSEIYFTLHYVDNPDDILLPIMQSKFAHDIAKDYIKSLVLNSNDIYTVSGGSLEVMDNGAPVSNLKSMNPSTLIHIPDYIIITCDSLKASFQRLADWKTQKGIYTIVVAVEDIYSNYQGYDNAEKIRNYLKDVYVNYGSSFILIGGDVDNVPTRFSPFRAGIFETDFYYATVQGNWNANGNDVFGESDDYYNRNFVFYVGRAPIHTNIEVNVFIDKTISYEKLNNTPNKNYVQNLSFWAGDGAKISGDSPEAILRLNTIDSSTNACLDPEQYFILKLYDHYNNSNYNYRDSEYIDRYYQLNQANVVEAMT